MVRVLFLCRFARHTQLENMDFTIGFLYCCAFARRVRLPTMVFCFHFPFDFDMREMISLPIIMKHVRKHKQQPSVVYNFANFLERDYLAGTACGVSDGKFEIYAKICARCNYRTTK